MGGFECSTHIDRSRRRQDFVHLTQHDRFFREDYERARSVGLRVVREGLRWHLIERGGLPGAHGPYGSNGAGRRYDFSSIAPMVDAAEELGITVINCLHHYGLPDGADPLHPDFPKQFADYAAAFAGWRIQRVSRDRWYGAVNETSLFAFAAGEAAWFYPFYSGSGQEVKVAMVKAALAATDAIRTTDPQARFVTIDPIIHLVAPRGCPHLAERAERENRSQWDAWDMSMGTQLPELGGGPRYVDVIGINCYPDGQKEQDTNNVLSLDDPRRRPFRDVLRECYDRYRRPIIIAESSARGDDRPQWLRYVVDECLAALAQGVDLQGICLFPLVDMREWQRGQNGPWGHLGLWDVKEDAIALHRMPNEPYLRALAEVQQRAAASGLLPVLPSGEPAITVREADAEVPDALAASPAAEATDGAARRGAGSTLAGR